MVAEEETLASTAETLEGKKTRLTESALELLDYHLVRQRIVGHTRFFAARRSAENLRPSYSSADVVLLQRETAEAVVFLDEVGDVDLSCDVDPTEYLSRAELEGVLSGHELLAVADLMEVLGRARSALTRLNDTAPLLAAFGDGIPDLRRFQRQIRGSIGERGEVLDSASPNLGPLRRQVRNAYQGVSAALESVLRSASGREALQDDVISMRGDRLVVQVKAEMRRRIPGIVHDASNTGATLFVEPFATVELCNTWRELALEEERETARILRELSGIVGDLAEDIKRGIELTAHMDFILARARYSEAIAGVEPVSQSSPQDAGGMAESVVMLLRARHPVLGVEAVPINVGIGPGWSVLVVTGPNTGGKTVAMKTVGLLAMLHQSGIRVPADEGSVLPIFDGIYADVGDHQSIERSVSRFGAHMQNVIDILSVAGPRSLVLLDELGTSTDPEEGSALAKAILEQLATVGVATVATTHHRTVAAHAETTPGMMNASVELDPDTLRPTYHLTIGIPGRSYAMSVAAQLGLPEEIMEKAESLLEPQYMRFEDWLSELQSDRRTLQQRLEEADEARAKAEASDEEHRQQLEELARRREDVVHDVRRELADEYDAVRKRLRRVEASLSWSAPAGEPPTVDVEEAAAELEAANEQIKEIERVEPPAPTTRLDRPVRVGDTVDVRGLNIHGTVVDLPQGSAEAEVAIGCVRLHLDLGRLSVVEGVEPEPSQPEVRYDLGPMLPTVELDLRGQRAEEALVRVEEFLDKAVRDGLSSVRIIHGKGTGALRTAVRELLERHPLAETFASEPPERGGDGATLVELT